MSYLFPLFSTPHTVILRVKRQFLFLAFLLGINSSPCYSQSEIEKKWAVLDSLAEAVGYTDLELATALADSAFKLAKTNNMEMEKGRSLIALATFSSHLDLYDTSTYFVNEALKVFEQNGNVYYASKALNRKGINYQKTGDYDSSLVALQESLRIQEEANISDSTANTLENISNTHMFLAEYEKSLFYAEQTLAVRRKIGSTDTVDSFLNLGIIYMDIGDYPASLDYYLRSLQVSENQKDSFRIQQVHSNIGVLYRKMKRYNDAEQSLKLALDYQLSHGLKLLAARTHNNLGNLYVGTGQNEKGRYHYTQNLRIQEEIGSEQDLWIPNLNLGYFNEAIGDIIEARKYFEKALKLADQTGNQYGVEVSKVNIASCYSQSGKHQNALGIANAVRPRVKEIDDLAFQEYAYYKCYTIYEAGGKLEEAISAFKDFVTIRDSILNQQKLSEIAEIETRYELQAKEREIALAKEQAQGLELKNELVSTQRNGLIGVAGSLIVVMLLTFSLYRSRIKRQRIEYQKLEQEASQAAKVIAKKNELLKELRSRAANQNLAKSESSNSEFLSLFKLVESSSNDDEEWKTFQEKFEKLHPTFLKRLETSFSNLTDNDLRLAALIRLRMTSKEIANAINIEHVSVQKARYRLKKKLDLTQQQDLAKFLYEF